MKRSLLLVAKILGYAELIYIGITALFLNSGILTRLINGPSGPNPQDLKISYDFAYSLFPGYARAHHLTIRVNDSDVQVYFHLHSVKVRVAISNLFHKEFVGSNVVVDGLDFRLRARRDKKELESPLVPFLPPIPGLLPVKTPEVTAEAPNPKPWKVRLTDVSIENLEEAWVEEYRYQGKMAVTGNLFLSPGHNTEVHDARIDADTGKVTLGDSEVGRDIHAHIRATLGPYEKTKFLKSNEILDHLSAAVEGAAQVSGFDFLNHYLRKVQPIHFSGGVGPLALHVVLENGRLMEGSTVKIQADDLKASLWDQRARGNAYIDWHIQPGGKQPIGRLSVLFPRFVIQHLEETKGRIEGRDLSLLATTPDLQLKEPFQTLDVEIRTPEARITDLSYFESYFPGESRVRLHGGDGTLDAAVFASSDPDHRDTGYLHLRTQGVHLDLKGAELQGDITVDGVLHQGNITTGHMDVSGTQVYLRKVTAATHFEEQSKNYRDWWGTIGVRKGVLQLKKHKSFQADIEMKGRDARPILGISTKGTIPGVLGGVLAFENLRAKLSLLANDEILKVSDAEARGDGVAVKGWLTTRGEDRQGKVLVEYGPTAAGLDIQGSEIELKLNDAYGWFKDDPKQEGPKKPALKKHL